MCLIKQQKSFLNQRPVYVKLWNLQRYFKMKRRIETYSDAWFYWIFAGTAMGFTLFRWAAWMAWAVMG